MRHLPAVLLVTLATPTAASPMAGAPGECASCVVPIAAPAPADLARRIGVGARVVSMSLAAEGSDATEYGGGGLAVSYRLSRRWELALALDALDAQTGSDLHSTLLSARFHLTPHRRWDWYLSAGLGGVHEPALEGAAGDGVDRGQVQVGAGLQRRFRRFGIAAELHAISVGEADESSDEMTAALGTQPEPARSGARSGGELTLAAMFYF